MIYKDTDLIIFQSPFQASVFIEFHDDVFGDGTFYVAPKLSYQVFIIRNYIKDINSYYSTLFAIHKNKTQNTYKSMFRELIKYM